MRNNNKLAIGTPCAIGAAIIACACYEVAALIVDDFLLLPGNAFPNLLYFGSLLLSLLFTVTTLKQLELSRTQQLFWIGIAAMPLLFLMVIAV